MYSFLLNSDDAFSLSQLPLIIILYQQMSQKSQQKMEKSLQRSRNFHNRLKLKCPRFLNPSYTYSCGNWAFINQKLLNDSEETFGMTQTFLNHNRLISVQERTNFLSFKVFSEHENLLPIQYALQRLQSQSNEKCMKLSMLIIEIQKLFADYGDQIKLLKFPSVEATLSQLGDERYIIFSGNIIDSALIYQNVFISKKMLKQMGYQPINFAISCMKMRTIIAEFIGNQNYMDSMIVHLTYIAMHLKMALGLEDKFSSHQQISDCLNIRAFSKIDDVNHNTLYCYAKFFVPSPNFAVVQVLGIQARIPSFKNKKILISPQVQRLDQMSQLRVINTISGQKKPKIIRAVAVQLYNQQSKESSAYQTQLSIEVYKQESINSQALS